MLLVTSRDKRARLGASPASALDNRDDREKFTFAASGGSPTPSKTTTLDQKINHSKETLRRFSLVFLRSYLTTS